MSWGKDLTNQVQSSRKGKVGCLSLGGVALTSCNFLSDKQHTDRYMHVIVCTCLENNT